MLRWTVLDCGLTEDWGLGTGLIIYRLGMGEEGKGGEKSGDLV